jgi:hypothetical protein
MGETCLFLNKGEKIPLVNSVCLRCLPKVLSNWKKENNSRKLSEEEKQMPQYLFAIKDCNSLIRKYQLNPTRRIP